MSLISSIAEEAQLAPVIVKSMCILRYAKVLSFVVLIILWIPGCGALKGAGFEEAGNDVLRHVNDFRKLSSSLHIPMQQAREGRTVFLTHHMDRDCQSQVYDTTFLPFVSTFGQLSNVTLGECLQTRSVNVRYEC